MDTFRVLSAFYMKEHDMLLVVVEGRDGRIRRGAAFCDAFGHRYTIEALAEVGGLPPEQAERITGFLVKGAPDIGRLIRLLPEA